MTWTTTAPTLPGWYWFRTATGYADLRHVTAWPAGGLVVVDHQLSKHADGVYRVQDVGGEWWGPIAEPEG